MGKWENGKMREWGNGRMGKWESENRSKGDFVCHRSPVVGHRSLVDSNQ